MVMVTMILIGEVASADTGANVATLAQPLSAKKEVIIGSMAFQCAGTTCVLVSAPSADAESVKTCWSLQRQVGAITAYTARGKTFDADKLAKCNAK